MENKIQKIGKFYQVITKHGDVISKRYKTRKGAENQLLKINYYDFKRNDLLTI
jgi:hypothetical protein